MAAMSVHVQRKSSQQQTHDDPRHERWHGEHIPAVRLPALTRLKKVAGYTRDTRPNVAMTLALVLAAVLCLNNMVAAKTQTTTHSLPRIKDAFIAAYNRQETATLRAMLSP